MKFTEKELQEEQWKVIETHPTYMISSLGRVKSFWRGADTYLEVQKNNYGEPVVLLTEKDGDEYTLSGIMVGKEVAKAFVPNPNGYKYIRFQDGDKNNCRAENLEWVKLTDRMKEFYSISTKAINQYDENGKYLKTWESAEEIAEFYHVKRSVIYAACNKTTSLVCNSIFRYAKDFPKQDIQVTVKNKTVAVLQYTKEGELVRRFSSITEAINALGNDASAGNITACCKGNRVTAYGYVWKYEEKQLDDEKSA